LRQESTKIPDIYYIIKKYIIFAPLNKYIKIKKTDQNKGKFNISKYLYVQLENE